MKEFTRKLIEDKIAASKRLEEQKGVSLQKYASYITELTAELEALRKEIADLEADLQAGAVDRLQEYRKVHDHIVAEWSHHTDGPRADVTLRREVS